MFFSRNLDLNYVILRFHKPHIRPKTLYGSHNHLILSKFLSKHTLKEEQGKLGFSRPLLQNFKFLFLRFLIKVCELICRYLPPTKSPIKIFLPFLSVLQIYQDACLWLLLMFLWYIIMYFALMILCSALPIFLWILSLWLSPNF